MKKYNLSKLYKYSTLYFKTKSNFFFENLKINTQQNKEFSYLSKNNILFDKKRSNYFDFSKANHTYKMEEVLRSVNKHSIKSSPIRTLDIGKNYFSHINPKRKKILMTLLNSYLKALTSEEVTEFELALDIFYKGTLYGKKISDLEDKEMNISAGICWHINTLFFFERTATSYCRFEYMDYHNVIEIFNNIPENLRNKAKYVITCHPTQPNSLDQIKISCEIINSIEENDLEYLDRIMKLYLETIKSRKFEKPNEFDELETTLKTGVPNIIDAFGMAFEMGFKKLSDFFEIPGLYLQSFKEETLPLDNTVGLISSSHATNIKIVVNEYLMIIEEANFENVEEYNNIVELLGLIKNYTELLISHIVKLKNKEISKEEYFQNFPKINLIEIEDRIRNNLSKLVKFSDNNEQEKSKDFSKIDFKNCTPEEILEMFSQSQLKKDSNNKECKITEVAKKLSSLFEIFGISGTTCQVKAPGKLLLNESNISDKQIEEIFREIQVLNNNGRIVEMIIISFYSSNTQYEMVKKLIKKFAIKHDVAIVPLLETFSNTNNTDSNITMIASSDTRKNDGIILTELRTLREDMNNPDKIIFMGQGISAERGGGPYNLLHLKYKSLVKSQKKRHIRTVQGYYFTSEFNSRDTAFTFLLTGNLNINKGQYFVPSTEYMDFLFELDSVIGVPQRLMQNSDEWNQLFINNPIIKTLTEMYNYSGSKDKETPLERITNERAVVQAYINSDRCSYLHHELAYWDRVTNELNQKIIKYYYENNPHFKYVLSNYAFMLRRLDASIGIKELGIDTNNKYYNDYIQGRNSLERILNNLGMGPFSTPIQKIYNQHLGVLQDSKIEESNQKQEAFNNCYVLQNYQVKKYLKEKKIGIDFLETENKIKILQSALSNVSQFNGKG